MRQVLGRGLLRLGVAVSRMGAKVLPQAAKEPATSIPIAKNGDEPGAGARKGRKPAGTGPKAAAGDSAGARRPTRGKTENTDEPAETPATDDEKAKSKRRPTKVPKARKEK